MAKVGPLTRDQKRASFLARFAKRQVADRIRQIGDRLGAYPYRVFLVWTRFSGSERGEGNEVEIGRIELAPAPEVQSLDGVTFSLFAAGALPIGSVRLRGVSLQYTYDQLTGTLPPTQKQDPFAPASATALVSVHRDHIQEPNDFYYEIVEDGRNDPDPKRMKFRLLSPPVIDPTSQQWILGLERTSEDPDRYGRSQIGTDTDD